jgi:thiamine pyrophosphate-dependent acetolactate synthase large subunit-like protein
MPGAASLSDPAFACTPRLVSPADLEPALKRALAAGKPALLNVAVQRAISPRAEAAIGRRKAAASQ